MASIHSPSNWDYVAMALGLYNEQYYLKASHFNPNTKLEDTNVAVDINLEEITLKEINGRKYFNITNIQEFNNAYYGHYTTTTGVKKLVQFKLGTDIEIQKPKRKNLFPVARYYIKDRAQKIAHLIHENSDGSYTSATPFKKDTLNGDIHIKTGLTEEDDVKEVKRRHLTLTLSIIPHIFFSIINVSLLTLKTLSFANFWMHTAVHMNPDTHKAETTWKLGSRAGFKAALYETYHDIARIVYTPLFLLAIAIAPWAGLLGAPMGARKVYATAERFLYHQSIIPGCFQPTAEGYSRVETKLPWPFITTIQNPEDCKESGVESLTTTPFTVNINGKDYTFKETIYQGHVNTKKNKMWSWEKAPTIQRDFTTFITQIDQDQTRIEARKQFTMLDNKNQEYFDYSINDTIILRVSPREMPDTRTKKTTQFHKNGFAEVVIDDKTFYALRIFNIEN